MSEEEVESRYAYGTGRRKTAVARVRIYPGPGTAVINDREPLRHFGRRELEEAALRPLRLTGLIDRVHITVKVDGGGVAGQAGAVAHGLARALCVMDSELRPQLKAAGLLTRDPRMKERKKPGLKRARKAPQYTKR
ncbi:ribosomal protein S9 [mine drainage metagenome]|uniref:Ribosomal protein S9 n=1 Tax=mine drainage metagenome TaxID=410659 RepID=T1BM55_9ZZZZ